MRKTNRKLPEPSKSAVFCGFSAGCLRFVKTLCTTIGSNGARVISVTNGAPFLLRDVCCARVCTHKHEGMQCSGSPLAHDTYGSDGHVFAVAAFLIGAL